MYLEDTVKFTENDRIRIQELTIPTKKEYENVVVDDKAEYIIIYHRKKPLFGVITLT